MSATVPWASTPAVPTPGPPNGPYSAADIQTVEAAQAPYLAKAKETYPGARARFLAGLPAGSIFLVAREIVAPDKTRTLYLVEVVTIDTGEIKGHAWLGPNSPPGSGAEIGFPETEVTDWLIHNPDGTEEGWYTGKFLYEMHTGKKSLE